MSRRVVLLTDFGTRDGYVAAMKGVIASVAPAVTLEDAGHDVPPGDIAAGAWALGAYALLYPAGTVHLAVVDPGVGTGRRALAGIIGERLFVAPDNGLLARVLEQAGGGELYELISAQHRREPLSATFHGRDLFAPAAAHLAAGGAPGDLGPRIHDPVLPDSPRPERDARELRGHVVHVDRFGNLVTNVPAEWLEGETAWTVAVAGREVGPVRRTYAEVGVGSPLAVVGSAGLVEVSVRDGDAAVWLGAGRGAPVLLLAAPSASSEERLGDQTTRK